MTHRQLLFALSAVLGTTSPTFAGDFFGSSSPCVNCPGGACSSCQNGSCNGCGERFREKWAEKKRSSRRWWYRHNQSKKALQHPECPPLFQPNWGYHQTCWRRFPPICNPCPPASVHSPAHDVPPNPLPPAPGSATDQSQPTPMPELEQPEAPRPLAPAPDDAALLPVFEFNEPDFQQDKGWRPTQITPTLTGHVRLHP